jgi:restriction system protein
MAIWLVRGGRHGEVEQKFIDEKRIFITWRELKDDIGGKTIKEMQSILRRTYPNAPEQRIVQNSGQFNIFVNKMAPGDTVLMPRRGQGVVQIGRITSDYGFDASGPDGFRHYRSVEWNPIGFLERL